MRQPSSHDPQAAGAGPLAGARVIECGEGVAAAFAGRLLADYGADVIKVEPPGGDLTRRRGPFRGDVADPEESGLFLYLNANKRGITLDLHSPSGRDQLERLLSRADILVHNVAPADRASLDLESTPLCAAYPALIVAAISAYGDTGPRAKWRAYELNAIHASGAASLNPMASSHPELPPLKMFGHQAEFHGGLTAAMVTVAAFWHRLQSGCGQAIEVSEQEAIAATLHSNFVSYTYGGIESSRLTKRRVGPWFIAKCADGFALFSLLREEEWQRLIPFMGNPAWSADPAFATLEDRARNVAMLHPRIEQWTRKWKVRDLFEQARAHRIPIVPLSTMGDVYADPHLRARGFFVPLPLRDRQDPQLMVPGAPFKSTLDSWSVRRPAPHLGEHNDETLSESPAQAPRIEMFTAGETPAATSEFGGTGPRSNMQGPPLAGVRVLDFTQLWVGPFCTQQLAHLGAEVIRVESRTRPCLQRTVPPFADGKSGLNRSGAFNQWNQAKRSIQLNLRNPLGLDIARRLVRHCDLAIENFGPGAMARMGLGYASLRELRGDIILLSISGHGQSGPYRNDISYGTLTGALGGYCGLCGYPGMEPMEPGVIYAEPTASTFGALAAILALIRRARTGQGQHIDLSMLETLAPTLVEGLLEFAMNGREPGRMGNHDQLMSPHQCYKAKGDALAWVAIAVGSDGEWRALCQAIGQPSLAQDPRFTTAELRKRNEDELDRIITAWTRERDRWEITRILQESGVAAIPTMTNKDLVHDPHLAQRGFLVQLEPREVGRRIHAGIPWTMSGTPCTVGAPAPLLGADTDDVLGSLLGYSTQQLKDLRESGVLI